MTLTPRRIPIPTMCRSPSAATYPRSDASAPGVVSEDSRCRTDIRNPVIDLVHQQGHTIAATPSGEIGQLGSGQLRSCRIGRRGHDESVEVIDPIEDSGSRHRCKTSPSSRSRAWAFLKTSITWNGGILARCDSFTSRADARSLLSSRTAVHTGRSDPRRDAGRRTPDRPAPPPESGCRDLPPAILRR